MLPVFPTSTNFTSTGNIWLKKNSHDLELKTDKKNKSLTKFFMFNFFYFVFAKNLKYAFLQSIATKVNISDWTALSTTKGHDIIIWCCHRVSYFIVYENASIYKTKPNYYFYLTITSLSGACSSATFLLVQLNFCFFEEANAKMTGYTEVAARTAHFQKDLSPSFPSYNLWSIPVTGMP